MEGCPSEGSAFGFSGAPKKPPPVSAAIAWDTALVPTGLDLGIPARGGGGGAHPLARTPGGPPGPLAGALALAGVGPVAVGAGAVDLGAGA